MNTYNIDDNGNIYDSYDDEYMGCVVEKAKGWSAYLGTDDGDEWIGDYATPQEAAQAVDDAYGEFITEELIEALCG